MASNLRGIRFLQFSRLLQISTTTKCPASRLLSTSVSAFAQRNSRIRPHALFTAAGIRKTLNDAGFKLCFSVAVGGTFNIVARASIIASKNTITWTEAYSLFGTVQTFKSGDGEYLLKFLRSSDLRLTRSDHRRPKRDPRHQVRPDLQAQGLELVLRLGRQHPPTRNLRFLQRRPCCSSRCLEDRWPRRTCAK